MLLRLRTPVWQHAGRCKTNVTEADKQDRAAPICCYSQAQTVPYHPLIILQHMSRTLILSILHIILPRKQQSFHNPFWRAIHLGIFHVL